jgi:hypothetical protein
LLNGNIIVEFYEMIDGFLLFLIFIVIGMQSESFESGGGE